MTKTDPDDRLRASMETEAKIPCADLKAVRQRLAEIGAISQGRLLEDNVVFDTREGELRSTDRFLRLRSYDGITLTYKGPRRGQEEDVKAREEFEVVVSDLPAAEGLLRGLGFRRAWVYEKYREEWRLGDAKILLDTLPLLGNYLEIEAPDREGVRATARLLGFDSSLLTSDTYGEIFETYLRDNAKDPFDLVFAKEERQ